MGIFPLICEIQTPDHHSQFKNRQQYSNQQSNYLWLIERTRHFFSYGLDWFRCIEHVKNKSHDLTIKIKSDWKPKLKKKTYFGLKIKPNTVCEPWSWGLLEEECSGSDMI